MLPRSWWPQLIFFSLDLVPHRYLISRSVHVAVHHLHGSDPQSVKQALLSFLPAAVFLLILAFALIGGIYAVYRMWFVRPLYSVLMILGFAFIVASALLLRYGLP